MGMETRLNRRAYVELIHWDLKWLAQQPHSVERSHIELVLCASPHLEYPDEQPVQVLTDPVDWGSKCSAYDHGRSNCIQSQMENAPFADVGGLEARSNMKPPRWMDGMLDPRWPEYKRGYEDAAWVLYGEDWRTCSFGWKPALTIERAEDAASSADADDRKAP